MTTSIALNNIIAEELYERAAACYVDMLDKSARPPKITAVMSKLCDDFPDIYPREHEQHYLAKLHNPDFNDYLEKYRGEYIQRQLAPKLLAAHMGHKIGAKALEQLIERLDTGEEISTKDLIALAQLGFGMAEKVGQEVKKTLGDTPQVDQSIQNIFNILSPEMAEGFAAELIRRQRKEQAVIDG